MPASYEVTEWIAADGTVTNLMDIPNVGIQPGRTGAFMPPIRSSEDNIPFQHGSRLKAISLGPREIDLPLYISAASEDALRVSIRALLGKFSPLDDDGRLRVTRPDGTQRELVCRYSRGMELIEDSGNYGVTYAKAIVTFRAYDPLWYDVTPIDNTFAAGAAVSFFPGTPFRLSSNAIFATPAPVSNDGDLEAWPVWTIQGPGSSIALRNLDTGEKLEFLTGVVLLAGESISIDTREGRRTVRKNDGTNLYGQLTTDSELWPLYKGSNSVRIDMVNTTVDSLVSMSFNKRYFSV